MAFYDAVLELWPRPYETLRLPIRHGETFIIASGKQDAPPLVLLHGAASNPVLWIGGADALFPVEKAADRLLRLLPRVQVEIIPGAGHALINMTERVLPFLRE